MVAYDAKVCFIFGTWYGVWAFFSFLHLWDVPEPVKENTTLEYVWLYRYLYKNQKCRRNLFVHGHMTDMARERTGQLN